MHINNAINYIVTKTLLPDRAIILHINNYNEDEAVMRIDHFFRNAFDGDVSPIGWRKKTSVDLLPQFVSLK